MFFEAIDDAYVDIIKTGPPYRVKYVPMTPDVPVHYIRKEKSEWSEPEKASMLRNTKILDTADDLSLVVKDYGREDSNTKFQNTDEDSDIKSDDPQVVEIEAMLVKGFRMMRLAKPQRKGGFNKKYSRDGKGKFIRNEGQYSKERKFDKAKVNRDV
ncbi:hypothetical protein AgCh_016393 [Apium graveolens]